MGREQIPIKFVEDGTKRKAMFNKRSTGLIKKAAELSILCGCNISLMIFQEDANNYREYSSTSESVAKLLKTRTRHKSKSRLTNEYVGWTCLHCGSKNLHWPDSCFYCSKENTRRDQKTFLSTKNSLLIRNEPDQTVIPNGVKMHKIPSKKRNNLKRTTKDVVQEPKRLKPNKRPLSEIDLKLVSPKKDAPLPSPPISTVRVPHPLKTIRKRGEILRSSLTITPPQTRGGPILPTNGRKQMKEERSISNSVAHTNLTLSGALCPPFWVSASPPPGMNGPSKYATDSLTDTGIPRAFGMKSDDVFFSKLSTTPDRNPSFSGFLPFTSSAFTNASIPTGSPSTLTISIPQLDNSSVGMSLAQTSNNGSCAASPGTGGTTAGGTTARGTTAGGISGGGISVGGMTAASTGGKDRNGISSTSTGIGTISSSSALNCGGSKSAFSMCKSSMSDIPPQKQLKQEQGVLEHLREFSKQNLTLKPPREVSKHDVLKQEPLDVLRSPA